MSDKLLKRFNEEQATSEQISKLRVRNAVRIIIIDKNTHIAARQDLGVGGSPHPLEKSIPKSTK